MARMYGAPPSNFPTVLHVITGLGIGGAEAMLVAWIREAVDRGARPLVISLKDDGIWGGELKSLLGDGYLALGMTSALDVPRGLFRLARFLSRTRPDLVQGWMYHGDLMAYLGVLLSGRRMKTPVFWGLRCSNMEWRRYSPGTRFVVWLCRLLSGRVDGILANSAAGRAAHLDFGYADPPILLVPNCVDTNRFRPDPDARGRIRAELGIPEAAFVFGMIARVDPMKGYDVFIDIALALPDMTGVAVGKGTKDLHLPDNAMGIGPRRDIPDMMAALDVVISTSSFGEGTSNSILEAMASGLPVLATDVGDAARLLRNPAQVMPVNAPDAFASRLTELRDDTALRHAIGTENRARAMTDMSRKAMVDRFLEAYRS